jgi:hypothetical protein
MGSIHACWLLIRCACITLCARVQAALPHPAAAAAAEAAAVEQCVQGLVPLQDALLARV